MIVFANVDRQEFELYDGQGKQTVRFGDTTLLYDLTKNEKLIYITSAMNVSFDDLSEFATPAGGRPPLSPKEDNDAKYIHMTGKGIMTINDLAEFEGPLDFRTLESLKLSSLEDSDILTKLVNDKLLEMVSATEAERIKRRYDQERNTKKAKEQLEEDRRSTSDTGKSEVQAGEKIITDAIPIEIGGGTRPAGRSSNEGSLLPPDFVE